MASRATATETKLFRLYVIFALAVLVGGVGTLFISLKTANQQQTAYTNTVHASRDLSVECVKEHEPAKCQMSRDMQRVASSIIESRIANEKRADLAAMFLPAVPAGYVLFLVLRFAMTGRLRPFWPWKLKEAA